MIDQVLTVGQMETLIKMGVDVSNASMCWEEHETYEIDGGYLYDLHIGYHPGMSANFIPAFTLYDILNMLPKNFDGYPLKIQTYGGDFNVINFGYWKGERAGWLHFCQNMHSTINSAYELLKWSKEGSYMV